MNYKKSTGEIVFEVFNYTFILFLMVITLYPFWYVTVASLSNPVKVMSSRGLLLFIQDLDLSSYKAVFNNPNIWTGYGNTLIYSILGTIVNMIMTILGAYALSRKNLLFKSIVMRMIVFTMYFGGGLIPLFLLIRSMGMLNTRMAMIIPSAISTYNLIILRTAFMAIPDSLEESARMDGANDFIIMCRIIVPLAIPSIAVISLYYVVGHWNSYFGAMVYLRERVLFPLQLILREILITNSTDAMTTDVVDKEPISETIKYAAIIVSTLPILCVYPFIQKYFVKGVMIGSLKG